MDNIKSWASFISPRHPQNLLEPKLCFTLRIKTLLYKKKQRLWTSGRWAGEAGNWGSLLFKFPHKPQYKEEEARLKMAAADRAGEEAATQLLAEKKQADKHQSVWHGTLEPELRWSECRLFRSDGCWGHRGTSVSVKVGTTWLWSRLSIVSIYPSIWIKNVTSFRQPFIRWGEASALRVIIYALAIMMLNLVF